MRPIHYRRLSQIVFLALFVLLLSKSDFPAGKQAHQTDIQIPYPVSLFLQADPLAAVASALSTGTLYRGLLWCLAVILPTLVLGRFFCGWICPLGTLNHLFSSFKSETKRGRRLIESNRYQPWQRWKYYVLAAVLAAALLGTGIAGIFDPISLSVRSLGLSILPGIDYAANAFFESLHKSGVMPLAAAGDVLRSALKDALLSFRQPYFRQALFLGLLFAVILALNFRITRFWCRALCPLGGLLGVLSRWAILGLEKHPAHCEDCNRCLLHCQGGDNPIPGVPWRKAECHLCLNCVADCPEGGIQFKFFPARREIFEGPNLARRHVLTGLAMGAAAVPVMRSNAGLHVDQNDRMVRPPGALDERNFLARCIRCGECMKVCPNNALHPALLQAGAEGLWTPVLIARIGYCEPSCSLCGQVCPTGAIWQFNAQEKGWAAAQPSGMKSIRLGTAFYDRGRCLPWSMATECIVCEEWCPTSPKAIYLQPAEVADRTGAVKKVRQPIVDPEQCVGCGACEYACPVQDRPAIYVTSIGESRSRTNQIILRRPPRRTGAPTTRSQP